MSFRIHHECAGTCQVKEHKGYAACDETTGECELMKDRERSRKEAAADDRRDWQRQKERDRRAEG